LEYFQNGLLQGGYLYGLHPILSYDVKQNTSRFTQFIGHYCYKLQNFEVPVQLFVNVLKGTHFTFYITYVLLCVNSYILV